MQNTTTNVTSGDIILFKGEADDRLNQIIMWLSDSKFTHAALVCDPNTLADEALSGLARHHFSITPSGRPACIMRMEDCDDLTPVLSVAQTYIDSNEPYDKPALVLAGLLLLHKKFHLFHPLQKIINRFLNKLARELDETIAKHYEPGKSPMTCSQFVSTVYTEAGSEYALKFKNADLFQQSRKLTLAEQCFLGLQDNVAANLLLSSEPEQADWEELSKDLFEELGKQDKAEGVPLQQHVSSLQQDASLLHETRTAVSRFCMALTRKNNPKEAIHTLIEGQEMLITPGDLRDHCINLTHIMDCNVDRENALA